MQAQRATTFASTGPARHDPTCLRGWSRQIHVSVPENDTSGSEQAAPAPTPPRIREGLSNVVALVEQGACSATPLCVCQGTPGGRLPRLIMPKRSHSSSPSTPSGDSSQATERNRHSSRFVAKALEALDFICRSPQPLLERLSLEYRETASLAALFENHIEVFAVVW